MALVSRGDEKSVPSERDEGHPVRRVFETLPGERYEKLGESYRETNRVGKSGQLYTYTKQSLTMILVAA
jgi:hypothetical protein